MVHILIVDDDPDFLELLATEMAHIENVRVDTANDPERALELLADHDYELIVSDWQLEGSTGPEVVGQADRGRGKLRSSTLPRPKTPVIFMSGSDKIGQTRALERMQEYQPVSFLLKSCGASLIRLWAENVIERFGAGQDNWGKSANMGNI